MSILRADDDGGGKISRVLHCQVVVETELDDEQVSEELHMLGWKLSKDIEGRMIVTASVLSPENAEKLWKAANLGPKPAPGSKVWRPKVKP